ncbi:MAG: Phosphopantothenoylcysteine decarboxylase/phosphopantothenate/cysteine ligase [Candidatus Gallionella acididurans]|uniref:Coenzyme A biosynthesis bifunctional protein CoaBC n=1 Tax=Candidatus Gallionella acididurans TaxID=1796491 RepID=A0A139BVB9_9PROT|nr:MAG: Phosphopantothenoylcysteine decarboxylase/phosphopantothenate/cysteine ligase [Candidatus Gallionella acididurans]
MRDMMEQETTNPDSPATRIILGVSGGIAAYKAAELLRLLVKQGIGVQVVMTEAACHFITPTTMQGLSGRRVYTDQWDASVPNNMAHIELSRAADAILIAPASADFIAKLAHGLADDLLSTLCLARVCPLIIAPAMNREMWLNAAMQRNVKQLIADGVQVLGPDSGVQACGEEGMGRMLEAVRLAQDIAAFLQAGNTSIGVAPSLPRRDVGQVQSLARKLAGKNILVTAGPTYEAIDTVRGITNRSSGKMGYAIAQAAQELGAKVTLVSGPTALAKPEGVQSVDVQSAEQMFEAVKQHVGNCDIFIGVAAVADYRVAQASAQKIKKSAANLTLELVPSPDILAYVANLTNPPFCVGFAAESENLAENSEKKRREKKLPLLVGNLVQRAVGSDDNELVLFDDSGRQTLPRADKLTLARQLMQRIAQRIK